MNQKSRFPSGSIASSMQEATGMLRMALMACSFLGLTCSLAHPDSAGSFPALERYPSLRDYFPYGFFFADGGITMKSLEYLHEPYETRREKIFHDLARHYVNAIIPANRTAGPAYLDVAHRYGLRSATVPLYLYHFIDGSQDLEWVRNAWSDHAREVQDHPALLSYNLVDEPHPTLSPQIQDVARHLDEVDPRHPAVYTHVNLPLSRDGTEWGTTAEGISVEWALLASLDVHLADHYPIGSGSGRDPWANGDLMVGSLRQANPDALHWSIIQAFAHLSGLPTVPELRVMIFHTLACGAKGIFFFTTGQSYVRWLAGFWLAPGDAWFGEDTWYTEISRIGRHLTSAGPLLIPRQLDPEYPLQVDTRSFRAEVRSQWLRPEAELIKPALHVGAFVGPDFDVLVIHNDDPWEERGGRITITGRGTRVYDLYDLQPVDGKVRGETVTFKLRFAPGDGRLYLVGEKEDFRNARQTILRHQYEREHLLAQRDLEIAARCGVSVGPAAERLQRARKRAEKDDFAEALQQVAQAQAQLVRTEAQAIEYARTRTALEALRKDFGAVNEWFDYHLDFLTGDLADPYLVRLAEKGKEYTQRFGALENDLRAGHPQAQGTEVLQTQVAELKQQATSFRPRGREQRRIALLQLGAMTEDDAALQDWMQMIYRQVDPLWANDEGHFFNARQRRRPLGYYELLWLHRGDRGGPVAATYSVSAQVDPQALSRPTVAAIREYVRSGGGLIVSGLAVALVDELGLDPVEPNEQYWGPLTVPGGGEMPWESYNRCDKVLGLRPQEADHPLFAGLEAGGFGLWDWDLSELIGKAVWRLPQKPGAGRVLAGYYSDGAEIPEEFAVVVEYTVPPGGKAVAVGDGLDPGRNRAHQTGQRWGTNQDRFIRNLVAYCARDEDS